jgi:hypothetical protein
VQVQVQVQAKAQAQVKVKVQTQVQAQVLIPCPPVWKWQLPTYGILVLVVNETRHLEDSFGVQVFWVLVFWE